MKLDEIIQHLDINKLRTAHDKMMLWFMEETELTLGYYNAAKIFVETTTEIDKRFHKRNYSPKEFQYRKNKLLHTYLRKKYIGVETHEPR